jgi:hypothetical protein
MKCGLSLQGYGTNVYSWCTQTVFQFRPRGQPNKPAIDFLDSEINNDHGTGPSSHHTCARDDGERRHEWSGLCISQQLNLNECQMKSLLLSAKPSQQVGGIRSSRVTEEIARGSAPTLCDRYGNANADLSAGSANTPRCPQHGASRSSASRRGVGPRRQPQQIHSHLTRDQQRCHGCFLSSMASRNHTMRARARHHSPNPHKL